MNKFKSPHVDTRLWLRSLTVSSLFVVTQFPSAQIVQTQGDEFGSSVASAGDVNADGVADFIVGARSDNHNGPRSGTVRVFSGKDGHVLFTFHGKSEGMLFGSDVDGAGDVNRDGYADLLIGAPWATNERGFESGIAWIYSGKNGRVLREFSIDEEKSRFGGSVSSAGDINRDGFFDVIVGASSDSSVGKWAGSAHLYSGKTGKRLFTFRGDSPGDGFGVVTGAGDVNGDGFADVAVGAYGNDKNGQDAGSVRVFSGKDGAVVFTAFGDTAGDSLGEHVEGVGDLNGDGCGDIIAGAFDADTKNGVNSGMARVFSGRDGRILHTIIGDQVEHMLGGYVGGAGDVNRDGFADLLVGSYSDKNEVRIYSGKDGKVLYTVAHPDGDGSHLKQPRSAGDVNGDNVPDIIVGAPGAFQTPNPGNAFIFSGSDGSLIRRFELYINEGNAAKAKKKVSSLFREVLVSARKSVGVVNGNFEIGAKGEPPRGWIAATNAARDSKATTGVRAEVVTTGAGEGKSCVSIELTEENPDPRHYAVLSQSLDATPYRGKRVRVRALLKVEPGANHEAGTWLRVELVGGGFGFFDNTSMRSVRTPDWTPIEIVGDIALDASHLVFGAYSPQKARSKVWVDAFSLEVLGATPVASNEIARPLSPSALESLVAFTKAFGYLRYFHPSDEAFKADWNELASAGVSAVESASSPEELAKRLQSIFGPVAPTAQFLIKGQPNAVVSVPRDANLAVVWEHFGVGLGTTYSSNRVYQRISNLPVDMPSPSKPLILDIGGGVRVQFSVSCFVGAGRRTLPQSVRKNSSGASPKELPAPTAGIVVSTPGRAERLGAVIQSWNIFQHFYPNFDDVQLDWHQELRETLTAVANDSSLVTYVQSVRRMVAKLKDGHGYVGAPWERQMGVGVALTWVGDEIVVCGLVPSFQEKLKLGDVILEVDGVSATTLAKEMEQFLPSSTTDRTRLLVSWGLLSGPAPQVELLVRGEDGLNRNVSLARGGTGPLLYEPRPNVLVTELRPGVWYVDMQKLSSQNVSDILGKIKDAKAIILDMRGHAGDGGASELFGHLTDKAMDSPKLQTPIPVLPDQVGLKFTNSHGSIQAREPRIKAKIIFLTDARAISQGEFFMDYVEFYKLGEIVGSPTAGTDGAVNYIAAGGLSIRWTGQKVDKHDGTPLNGVGILPTVLVKRTIEGIRAGKDEVLERAIEIALRAIGQSSGAQKSSPPR